MFRWLAGVPFLALGLFLIGFALRADASWFAHHVTVPALYQPPPRLTLPLLRILGATLGCGCLALAVLAPRLTLGGAARNAVAIIFALGVSEIGLRALYHAVGRVPIEVRLSQPDPQTGWAFIPHRTLDLPSGGPGSPTIRYAVDDHGDRAESADWIERAEAPTVVVAGESTAAGHGLQWSDTFAARLGTLLGTQVVDVAEGGYGSDQAHLRLVQALGRLSHPVVVVTTVLPVQLHRNLRDDRPHLVLVAGELRLAPARSPTLMLRQLLWNDLPYLSGESLAKSVTLTRQILAETSKAARGRGADPLFVVPSYGPKRAAKDHPEWFALQGVLEGLPYAIVDIDPSHALPGNGHPDAEGATLIAETVAQYLHGPLKEERRAPGR